MRYGPEWYGVLYIILMTLTVIMLAAWSYIMLRSLLS